MESIDHDLHRHFEEEARRDHECDECGTESKSVEFSEKHERLLCSSCLKIIEDRAEFYSIPQWYKDLSLLQLQLKSLQEDIPVNLTERSGENMKDIENFTGLLKAMRTRLDRAFNELKDITQ